MSESKCKACGVTQAEILCADCAELGVKTMHGVIQNTAATVQAFRELAKREEGWKNLYGEKLEDLEDAIKAAQNDNPDEKHCTCVPLLKVKIQQLNKYIDEVEAASDKNFDAYLYENTKVAELMVENAELRKMANKAIPEERYQRIKESWDALFEEKEGLLKRITELESQNRWIPVGERLPKKITDVLILTPSGLMDKSMYLGGRWTCYGSTVTHWRELPEKPKDL